jgi:hypothetical protein
MSVVIIKQLEGDYERQVGNIMGIYILIDD